ncbi:solute carrier family 22 member 15-like isoform X2 [Portunus trituberculatus]|uniref:solute carrier family 22 member 15-like isoform X2 n=1 Tax=Portunus trituberculatus TaxID=210409 RepID=UPI001E1CC40C|nr:solute carrier family 22 member 15-like isoform X2 [Portunus trituberculatus]
MDCCWGRNVGCRVCLHHRFPADFLVVYVQCAELYPTTHRAAGTGLTSIISSCFGITAPYIAYLAVFGAWLPYIILFVIGLVGFLAASLLPETLNTDLPQSLFDAKTFLTSEKYWSYKGRRFCASTSHNRSKNKMEGHNNMGCDSMASCDRY